MISGITQSTSTAGSGSIDLTALKARQQEMFAQMDSNGDGSIDQAEFSSFGQQMAEKMKRGPRAEEMFAQMDADGDGSVTETEFEAFRPAPKEGMAPPPGPEEMFAAMDINGDGTIDQSEFEAFGQKMEQVRADGTVDNQVSTDDEVTATLPDYLEESNASGNSAAQTVYQQYLSGLDTGSLSILNLLG